MPGKSRSRWAATNCSSQTKLLEGGWVSAAVAAAVLWRHRHESPDRRGQLDAREERRLHRVAQGDGEIQAAAGDVREGVRRVNAERRQHGHDIGAEVEIGGLALRACKLRIVEQMNACLVETWL